MVTSSVMACSYPNTGIILELVNQVRNRNYQLSAHKGMITNPYAGKDSNGVTYRAYDKAAV